jgi:predicted  nucleic acid-binding Zn-ribbon protein
MNEIQNIDTLTTEILILKQQTAQNIIEIGKRLISVKESLPHGEWGKWLEEKVDFTDRTAQRFMKVANEFTNTTALSDLPKSKVFALLDLPPENRDKFIQENDVEAMSTRELQQAIKENKELESKLKRVQEKLKKDTDKLSNAEREQVKLKEKIKSIETKNKEELTNKEAEIENLSSHIENIKKQLSKAHSSGDNEEVEKLQESLYESSNQLTDANKRIEELEEQLKAKPIEVVASPEVIEKVPEEVEKELQNLREKLSQASANNEPVVMFKAHFDILVNSFKNLLGVLAEIEDEEAREKRKGAVSKLINKMLEQL